MLDIAKIQDSLCKALKDTPEILVCSVSDPDDGSSYIALRVKRPSYSREEKLLFRSLATEFAPEGGLLITPWYESATP